MDAFLREQAALHPCMQPRDALKMCYQAAFGAEHLLRDPGAAAAYLRDPSRTEEPSEGYAAELKKRQIRSSAS